MMKPALLLAFAMAAEAPTVIHQSTSGWCSPVIANVTGNVTVNCIGVDPRALNRLNSQLSTKNQQLSAKIAEANQWVDRYHELENQLKQAGVNPELSGRAQEYIHQGDFEAARTILDQLIKADEKQIERVSADYYQRGLLAELEFKPLEALPDFERAYRLSPDKLMTANKYSSALLSQHEYAKAEPVLNDAIQKGRDDVARDPGKYRELYAWLLYSRAVLMAQTSRFKNAELDYKETEAQFRLLAKDNVNYQQYVSSVLIDLANLYQNTGRMEAGESAYNEAVGIVRGMPDSEKKQVFLAESLMNASNLYLRTGRNEKAITTLEEAVGLLRQLVASKPAAYEADLGLALNNMAACLQAAGRLPEAEKAAREATEIQVRAAAANPGAHNDRAAQAFATLGNILSNEHRRDEADASFQKSLAIFRELAHQSPEGFEERLATVLHEAGLNSWGMNKYGDAEKAFDESLQIWRRLAAPNFEVYGGGMADAEGDLGRVYVDDKNGAAAEPLLREAIETYKRLKPVRLGQYDAPAARDLQVLALLYITRKDLPRARQASEEGLEIFNRLRNENAVFDHESMARCTMLYAALTERENPSRACTLVGGAVELATDAATRQGLQLAFQNCSRNKSFQRTQ